MNAAKGWLIVTFILTVFGGWCFLIWSSKERDYYPNPIAIGDAYQIKVNKKIWTAPTEAIAYELTKQLSDGDYSLMERLVRKGLVRGLEHSEVKDILIMAVNDQTQNRWYAQCEMELVSTKDPKTFNKVVCFIPITEIRNKCFLVD